MVGPCGNFSGVNDMPGQLEPRVLDFGLNEITTAASHMVVCAAEPTVYSLCSIGAANALGFKSFGAGNAFGVPSDQSVNGRYVASANITSEVCMSDPARVQG
jgi:hypothetical protein